MCDFVRKIVRRDQQILLGMYDGLLSIVDTKSCKITISLRLYDAKDINDIIVIDSKHFLVAAQNGVFSTFIYEVIKQSFTGKWVNCICHVTESVYLISLYYGSKLIVWNEQTDEQLFHIKSKSV